VPVKIILFIPLSLPRRGVGGEVVHKTNMKIMVFTEGTITIHKTAINLTREEQILHAKNKIVTPGYFFDFVPIKNAVNKLTLWKNQGAEICYITSRKIAEEVDDVKRSMKRDDFPDGPLFFRQEKEKYKDVAERVIPDILIEDDYESHGGIDKITITHVRPEIKARIKSIIIREFEGIDHLPDKISDLIK